MYKTPRSPEEYREEICFCPVTGDYLSKDSAELYLSYLYENTLEKGMKQDSETSRDTLSREKSDNYLV